MAAKAGHVQATPLYGGRSNTGVCTLLELGGARILLDCGATTPLDYGALRSIAEDLRAAGGVDAILLSHADIHHCGALPIVAGQKGVQNATIICTNPVYKFSQVLLYDYLLNQSMEVEDTTDKHDFDDIDHAFKKVITVKYNQQISIPDARAGAAGIGSAAAGDGSVKRQIVTVSAIAAGRTIGGTIWRIRCGPAEVLYAMDINLTKERVIDRASLDTLPTSPALMITEGACVGRGGSGSGAARRKKGKEDVQSMINTIMDTVRAGGNVLIPCETAGRVLEVLQVLNAHWCDKNIRQYHLVFLSHMAHNVLEFARCQLEWMSDSLNSDFYKGKRNPFELSSVKVATTVRMVERNFPGPKVVLATDYSLTHGLAKELLLKWGGDPRSKVIFFDSTDQNSLATMLKDKALNPPVIATISKPTRVALTGQELIDYRLEQERQRRQQEEELQRKRRQQELSEFQAGEAVETAIEDEENAEGGASAAETAAIIAAGGGAALKDFKELAAKRLKTSAIANLTNFNFMMFESKTAHLTMDDFGLSNEDLQFKDIQATESRWAVRDKSDVKTRSTTASTVQLLAAGRAGGAAVTAASAGAAGNGTGGGKAEEKALEELQRSIAAAEREVPFKLVPSTVQVQFTCDFKEFNVGGRLDFNGMKALLSRVTPVRLLITRGNDVECDTLLQYAKGKGMEVYAPRNRRFASFDVHTERWILQIPRSLVPTNVQVVRPTGGASAGDGSGNVGSCTVSLLRGDVSTTETSNQEGTRVVKFIRSAGTETVELEELEDVQGEVDMSMETSSLGVVSMGEVTLHTLRASIEAAGVKAEFRFEGGSGALVCADQVIIRKDGNQFSIEGPPVKAFFEARKAVYSHFAFL